MGDDREEIARIIDPLPFDNGPTGWVGMPELRASRRREALAKADAILSRRPEGWVLAPEKPTREMIEAGDDYAERALVRWGTCPDSDGHYTAMLAARPKEAGR